MKPSISIEIKNEIERLWLLGLQRDRIADNLNVSAGTVSHTVSEWRDRLGAPLAKEVRDLCVIAKTQNVTLLQCAEGFRFLNQLKNCGLKLDQIMPFILEFYNLCVSADKEPKEIFSICNEIFELHDPVPLAQLPEFISKLVERKRSLESDISKVEIAIKGLQQEFSELFDKVSVARFHLERYRKVEQELKKFDLNLQNLQKVNTIIENVNIIGSDPKCIIRELTEIKNCRQERRTAQNEKLVSENSKLSFENQTLRSELDLKSVNLRSLNERHKAIEQEFDRRSFQKVLEYENKIKEERKAYLAAEARNIQNINTLKAKEKQQMSILNKINVPFELSPIIDAARGWQVDGESLKRATIISIELLCSRLDDNHNWEAKSKMLQPLRSLKEEFIIF